MSGEFLRVDCDAGIRRLVLCRPPLNVLHIPMLEELNAAVGQVADDADARVLVVTGEGRAFCAGVDVADHTPDRVERMLELFHGAIRRLLSLRVPVVAAVNGAALGGGCELAIACDIVLVRADAKIGQPEIRLGALPPVAAALLPRRIGLQRALDLILSGRVLTGEEATASGLCTRLLPADEFEAGVSEYANNLASLSRPVVALAKRATVQGAGLPLEQALAEAERIYLEELMGLADAREGLAAFMEKREPVWSDA